MAVGYKVQITIDVGDKSLGYLAAATNALLTAGVPSTSLIANTPDTVTVEISNPEQAAAIQAALNALSS